MINHKRFLIISEAEENIKKTQCSIQKALRFFI